jgi:YVTN family beta-propeller protein
MLRSDLIGPADEQTRVEMHRGRGDTAMKTLKSYIASKRNYFNGAAALALALALGLGAVQASSQEKDKSPPQKQEAASDARRIVHEGIAIELSIEPVTSSKESAGELVGGEDAIIKFKITDTATGTPVTSLRPAAWLDFREKNQATDAKGCREKIQAFLQGSLSARPDVDLNSYYIIVMNKEPSISVIDPLLSFGTSKLLSLVLLSNPGEDWVLSRNGDRLFVSMPMSNQIAVVDTRTWKVTNNIDAGFRPSRIAFQKDEKYIWATAEGVSGAQSPSGVVAIDAATLKVAARIATGAGRHEMVFSSDDRYAFVTNSVDGTLSVIDVQRLAEIREIKIGKTATSLAFSSTGKAVYAIDEAEGAIVVIDSQSHEPLARVILKPGIKSIRFAPNSRWAILINPKENAAYIFDAFNNKILHTLEVGAGSDQISFTANYAYIRSADSEHVYLIPLVGLDKGGPVQVTKIPGGQVAPDKVAGATAANAIVAAPEPGAVLIANPADQTIYYYTEGMAAPMGNFQNYRREPRAVAVVDRSIREASPGLYSAIVKMPAGGNYDLAFLLDSPRVVHCFDVAVKPNPAMANRYPDAPLKVEYLIEGTNIRAGEKVSVRFKLLDPVKKEPKAGLKDVGVLTFLAPGIWQERQWATQVGEGVYEITFTPPEPGVYYIFLQCPSLKIKLNELPHMILDGRQEKTEE